MTTAVLGKSTDYSLGELMVAAAAREIRDGEICFVGMRLPLIAFVVAKRTHAPNAVGLFENGVIRATPARELIYTMADPPNILGATQCLDMLSVMSLLQSGRVHLGFLGAAEVDRFGNLNSTQIGPTTDGRRPTTRLPGSGGACDIASLAQRFVCLLEHSKRRLPARVSYITSPGNGDGGNWRQRVGLPRGGPSAVITSKCVLRFRSEIDNASASKTREGHDFSRAGKAAKGDGALAPAPGEAYLASVHPGVNVDDVLSDTGWPLHVSPNICETPAPTPDELTAIREYDREGFWTK
jgi:glutaconate CoA-transferase subunit B